MMWFRLLLDLWILGGLIGYAKASVADDEDGPIPHEFCITESFSAECGANEVLMIDKARFGRMALGRCVTRNFGNLGCSVDVSRQVEDKCSGRRKCEFSVSDALLVRTQPCPKDFSSYLQAEYRCIPVHSEQMKDCSRTGYVHVTGHQQGHISSLDSSLNCPYRIEVPAGQRLNLTLMDFRTQRNSTRDYNGAKYCEQFLVIEEKELGRSLTVCRQGERSKNVYTSKSHIVDVWVKDSSIPFLLYFQAVGCAQYVAPEGSYARIEDETMLIMCNQSRDSYVLTCRDKTWEGEVKNCSTSAKSELKDGDSTANFIGLPPLGISIVIILGVALVVVVYVAIMIVCVLYLRKCNHLLPGVLYRRRKETIRPGEQNQPPTLSSQDHDTYMEGTYPKSMPNQEERLPMLMKGTIFRTSTGEYTDICEMHDLSSVKEYSLSMNSCTCGTCSPANVRRIHIPQPRMNMNMNENNATLPTFRTFNGGGYGQQASTATLRDSKKIYDTARGLKSVKLVDRGAAPGMGSSATSASTNQSNTAPSSSSGGAPQYYFQLDANNVHQQVSGEHSGGGGPDLVPPTSEHQHQQHQVSAAGQQPQFVAMPPNRALEKKS